MTPVPVPGINTYTCTAPGQGTPAQQPAWWAAVTTDITTGRATMGDILVIAAGDDGASGVDLALVPIRSDPRLICVGADEADSTPGAALMLCTAPGVTSAQAAEAVAGIAAQMLAVNPQLGWRDVQEILAVSCTLAWGSAFTANAASHWNGGGLHFENDLGFGLINITVAVNLAQAWPTENWSKSSNLVTVEITQNAPLTIGGDREAMSILTCATALRMQHVQVSIEDTALLAAETDLFLTSPSGTESPLLYHPPTGTYDLDGAVITSNAFWGEPSAGNWTLTVVNRGAAPATLTSWTLTVWGDGPPAHSNPAACATPYSIITPEYPAMAELQPTRLPIKPNGTMLYLASLPGLVAVDLAGGACMLDGVTATLLPGFTSCSAVGCTGSVTIAGAGSGTLTGGSGPTSITAVGGDSVICGPGQTTVTTTKPGNIITASTAAASELTCTSAGGDYVYVFRGVAIINVAATATKPTTVINGVGMEYKMSPGASKTYIGGVPA